MKKYNFREIERKWQRRWEEAGAHTVSETDKRPKYYCLDMFPYPSGKGLHVGHWRGYVLSDVWSRYKKLQGYSVLHPMGWDSFGLPAENDAIKRNLHPRINTQRNIENMKRQLKQIGAMYDWTRELNTCDPEYYHWTQWIFLQMYKRGLAYRKLMPINWCPSCKTGLANEEVIDGNCERCGSEVTKKDLMQWMLKITEYADRLLYDLEKLKWPKKVLTMQQNWIGRSEGANIVFKVFDYDDNFVDDVTVFTTRADTLFGATFMTLAPEHPLVDRLTAPGKLPEIKAYRENARKAKEIDRVSAVREKTGIFTGGHAVNPVNNEKIPIWIADYVLISYGTGAIMAVPAHDERDFEFAKKYNIPIREVIFSEESIRDRSGDLAEAYTGTGHNINSGVFSNMASDEASDRIIAHLEKSNLAEHAVSYKLRDWVFSRQRYWGEPIPIVYCSECGEVPLDEDDLPLLLPDVEKYQPTRTGKSPLANIVEWVNTTCPRCGGPAKRETDTMPQWAGSCWYFLRYVSNRYRKGPFEKSKANKWLPVDMYVGGVEHAILHLLYARFFTKVLFDIGMVEFDEPFSELFNQGMILKRSEKSGELEKMSKSKGNVVNPDALIEKHGTDSLRCYELFIGPPEVDSEWQDSGIIGMHRFLQKVWNWVNAVSQSFGESNDDLNKQKHLLVKDVTERLETFHFNTALSRMMEFINYVTKGENSKKPVDRDIVETYLILLSPFAPHTAEELWEMLGHDTFIFESKWPEYDPALARLDTTTIAIQINGKLRGTVDVPLDSSEEYIREKALLDRGIVKHLNGKRIKKVVFVRNKLMNFVLEKM